MKFSLLATLPALAMLTACGGGETSSVSFSSLGNQGLSLLNTHQNAQSTSVQNMPSGTFSYNGVAAYSPINSTNGTTIINNAMAVSSINLNANFSTNSMAGGLSNFIDSDNYTASGSVPLTGTISDNGFTASGAAVVVSSFDNSNLLTTADINGQFFGDEANVASGLMSVSIGNVSGSGVFVAER